MNGKGGPRNLRHENRDVALGKMQATAEGAAIVRAEMGR
jgi:hypothetical protein